MVFIPEWKQILFLACPIMKDLRSLVWTGLFVNDLSMHDYSRDIMLATSQEAIEMRMALGNAELRATQLNNQIKKLKYAVVVDRIKIESELRFDLEECLIRTLQRGLQTI